MWWATASASVDLPTPGSPPTRMSDPGTTPPPSTRSTSVSPVRRRTASSRTTSAIGTASAGPGPPAWPAAAVSAGSRRGPGRRPAAGAARRSSTRLFHAEHPGQRPSHLLDSYPHSWQTKTVRGSAPPERVAFGIARPPDYATARAQSPGRRTAPCRLLGGRPLALVHRHRLALLLEDELVVVRVDDDLVAGAEPAAQHRVRQRVFHEPLNRPPQRPRPVLGIVALLGEYLARRLRHRETHALAADLASHAVHQDVDDRRDLVAVQR